MRRIASSFLCVFGGFVFATLLLAPQARSRAGSSPGPASSGDANGDGELDISDVVYTLLHLFKGGPPPVPLRGVLPATGLRTCFRNDGSLEACRTAETCANQDGYAESGCPSEGRFVDIGDGTISDLCTGLMWKMDPEVSPHEASGLDWCSALRRCDQLEFAGRDDWRLPNINELASLMNWSGAPWLYDAFDPLRMGGDFWTSTTVIGSGTLDYARVVGFADGIIWQQPKYATSPGVLAVRGP